MLAVSLAPVDAADVVLAAVDELDLGPDDVELALDPDLPPLRGRSGAAAARARERAGERGAPLAARAPGCGSRPAASAAPPRSASSITARASPPSGRDDIFAPFQRLGDTDNTTGLGLGLALSKGFTEGMGGTLTAEDTPGGGLTMVIALPWPRHRAIADEDEAAR